ncbi:MAG: prolipoprotein diacylglyceryl transferase [Candidatus Aegiribacteria sp.]|nr:prolipoprotein diacylglyceryl transferase [Candidatus Aegiribacteria sp.]MBD3294870.1 prolipoprotein diacylglyceryl transferase [Candidatus Fermentibacteria bacterium]
MHPVLFRLGSLPINTYGFMLAVSFVLGLYMAARRSAAVGVSKNDVYDLGMRIMIAAIVGSRVFYVLTHIEEFQGNWLDTVAIWKGLYGLSMLGGVLLAVAVGFYTVWRKKLPVWRLADAVIPSFALGIFVTRIGCFFNGCCFGFETSCPLGVAFPDSAMAYGGTGIPAGTHLHPTQLYSSVAGLFILLVLLWADRRKHFPGFIFVLFSGLYGVTRFGLEEFRYFDHDPNMMFGFSEIAHRPGITDNQLISLLMLAGSLVLGAWLYLKYRRTC